MIASVTELLSTIVPVLGVPIWYLGIGGPAVILIGFIAYYFLVVRFCNVQIFFNHTHRNESLLALCKTLKTYDRVPLWGVNGHVQSIYASQIRKGPTYPLRRELLTNRHGGHFAIDWLEDHKSAKGLICIVPGIAGHTGNDYIKNFIHYCREAGFDVVSYNWPGCGEHTLTYVEWSTLGDSTDLAVMFKHVRKERPDVPLYGVGFSLGANLLLRYLGQVKEDTPLKSAVSMSAGYCGRSGYHLIKRNIYSRALVKKWKEVINKSEHLWADHPAVDMAQVRQAETLDQLDTALSSRILQYETTVDYYADHGSIDFLQYIRIPTLMLNAEDDPIVKAHLIDLAKSKVPDNDNLILATTKYGGHMGWVRTPGLWKPEPELWMDRIALEFHEAVRKTLGTSK